MREGVDKIREIIENPEEGSHVTEIEVPDRCEKEAYDKLKAALANNKPKKGGKGKKGKGKKKKKAWEIYRKGSAFLLFVSHFVKRYFRFNTAHLVLPCQYSKLI